MKYMWSNQNGVQGTLSMQTGEFIGREYHIKVMDNPQHESPKKAKRFRSAFTTDQVNYLEKQFKKFPYIGNAHRKEVASALNIPERAVKIWFQNRRMKEKKESNMKEFDDEQNIRKSLEFAKDQLINVSAPSANEPRSLPILTDMSPRTCNNSMTPINPTYNNTTRPIVQALNFEAKNTVPASNVVTTAKVIHPPSVYVKTSDSPPNSKTSAEFSIDLCKKYKAESLAKQNVEETFKNEAEDMKKTPKSAVTLEQMIPEDLSPKRAMNIPATQQQTIPGQASTPGYVSLVPTVSPFYSQPYISASGVIWKPVNVMPVVTPNSSPVSSPTNPLLNMPPVPQNISKICNCDCHVRQAMPQVPYYNNNFPQQSPSPQYIITAVPFQNPSSTF